LTYGDLAVMVQRIAAGDTSAVGELYDATGRLVFGLILRILADRDAAEEVLLDVYTQAWRQADSYNPTRGSPLAWLTTIARSRAIDRFRAGRQDRGRESVDALEQEMAVSGDPEHVALSSEREQLVRSAMESLAPEQRQPIELAYYSGLSHNQISERLGVPLGTIKTRVRLGMAKLAGTLRPLLDDKP
jgi:RNA polymerase sigma-70 factor (ECF subfamily)